MTMSLLNIGARGLAAAQGSLATVSHNIANANTVGYSRQEVVVTSAGGQMTGVGFFGRGVDITTVRRQYDQFLAGTLQTLGSQSAADVARAESLAQLDALFADAELGVGAAMDNFFSAVGDVANRPGELAARQAMLARLDQLTQRFNDVGTQLQALGTQANERLAYEAGQVNQQLSEVRRLNELIARYSTGGQPPNDLLDQRDEALRSLGALMSIRTVAADDGSINVFTPSGAPLLVGQQQAVIDTAPDPADNSRLAVRLTLGGTRQWLDEAALGGGSLAGTLRFRDTDLASTQAQLGRLALALAGAANEQQALGVDASGAAGQPLFTIPAPLSRAHAANTGSGTLGVSIAAADALQASDYRVSWDGSNYSITRLSDQRVTSGLTLPATLDGLNFGLASGTPAAGDSWLVQPFADAAARLSTRGLSAAQLATGLAAMPQAAAGNTGSARVASFEVVRATADTALPVSIVFNDPPTSFNVTGLSGGPLTNVPYVPGQPVPAAPADYNGWRITLQGTAAAGDRFDVQRSTAPGTDNRNALALGRLAGARLVEGSSLGEGYAALVGHVGSRVQSGRVMAEVSGRMEAEARARKEGVSGVNLDEEAANLLRFQQAYQACAKIIQASQSIFDSLLAAAGR